MTLTGGSIGMVGSTMARRPTLESLLYYCLPMYVVNHGSVVRCVFLAATCLVQYNIRLLFVLLKYMFI